MQSFGAGRPWGAAVYVYYVSGKVWKIQLYVIYVSGRLWERDLHVFHVSGTPWGVGCLTNLSDRVGPLKKDLARERRLVNFGKFSCTYVTIFYVSGSFWEAHSYKFYVSELV